MLASFNKFAFLNFQDVFISAQQKVLLGKRSISYLRFTGLMTDAREKIIIIQ